MTDSEAWYIVKQPDGHCEIVPAPAESEQAPAGSADDRWGPFESQAEAIARRVGLIRSGKCQPV